LFVIIGLFVGFISGFFGIGGGTILVPAMLYLGLDLKYAISVSVMQMVFSSVFGSYLNFKSHFLDIKDAIYIGGGGFLGAMLSGFFVAYVNESVLGGLFLFFVMFGIYRFFKAPNYESSKVIEVKHYLLVLLGIFVGFFAISIGVGGSLILTPILVGYMGYNMKKATSIALFFIIFSSISGVISLYLNGFINYDIGLIVGFSSLVGVFFGIKGKNKIDYKRYKDVSIILYFVVFILTAKKLFF
jgi:hypothetical protein